MRSNNTTADTVARTGSTSGPLGARPGSSSTTEIAELRILDGASACRHYRLERRARIGRSSEAEICLDDGEVSRFHACVTRIETGEYEIEDLGSRNGTFVNGVRVHRARLTYGDRVNIGKNALLEFERYDVAADEMRRRQRFETVGRFGLGIAHDLNNLLAVLVAGASYLEELPANQPLGQADVRECIGDLVLAARRASDLAHSMLSFAKGRSGERTFVNVSELVREVVRLLRRVVDQRIRIEVSVGDDVVVHGCWSELLQAVMNLGLNARDAMPEGGVLTITASLLRANALGPGSSAPAAVLSLADTGIGMDEATRARVFEPLFSTKQHAVSYGLGLSTVHEIVARHGGRITVESEPGKGSRFSIYLPQLSEETTRQSGTEEGASSNALRIGGPPLRMLLVDDDPIVRRSLARQLKAAGVDVTEASTGAEAVGLYRRHAFELVVIDVDAPGLDGTPAHLALAHADPDVHIVLATASDERKAASNRPPNIIETVHKPYRVEALMDLATRCAGG